MITAKLLALQLDERYEDIAQVKIALEHGLFMCLGILAWVYWKANQVSQMEGLSISHF